MAVQVLIPTPLQKFTNEEATASLEASSIDELLQALEGRYPGLLNRLCDEEGIRDVVVFPLVPPM